MPVPQYGHKYKHDQIENAIADAGGASPEVLGTIKTSAATNYERPPWEVDSGYRVSDARGFVDVPEDWTLRWLNPRVIDREGWRYWRKVEVQDKRVKLKVDSMLQVDNTIRRGGASGDILCWMPTEWVVSMRKKLLQDAKDLAGTAETKRQELNENFQRGRFGEGISGEASHASSPVNAQNFGSVAR